MIKIKDIIGKIRRLSKATKIKIVIAMTLTVCLIVSSTVYAWFSMQKKTAEMFKVQYPNSLFINAAHREDRVYFELGSIDVNAYEKDEYGNTIYYAKNSIDDVILYARDGDNVKVDEYGYPMYDTENGEPHKIKDKQYVFSVSGSGMDSFILQFAHTTNNKFTYTIYEATQYTSSSAATTAVTEPIKNEDSEGEDTTIVHAERVVKYTSNKNSHNENDLQVAHDPFNDSAEPMDYYYVRTDTPLDVTGYKNEDGKNPGLAIKSTSDSYYNETYGSYTNVHENAMPLYWQTTVDLEDNEIDANKGFSKYFIVRITWNDDEQKEQTKKETDMIYISAKRN